MFQSLVSHNPDLAQLVDLGYAVALDVSNHLVVRDIPYLDSHGDLQWGALVAKLVFEDQVRVTQDDHQVYFAGSAPHELTGQPVANLAGGPITILLSDACSDVVVQRSFSNKPRVNGTTVGYENFFAKIEGYVAIISGPAMARYNVSPLTFRSVSDEVADPIFKFRDTLTSKAEVGDLASRLESDVIAIIGLGGTGSYVLDYLVKTRVKGIRGFDSDYFHVHNSFRAPGRTLEEEFNKPKAEVLQERYSNFRHDLSLQVEHIDHTNADRLNGVTFAFVCVDEGPSRAEIFDLLIGMEIPFIDVGMGLKKKPNGLRGSLRVTQFLPDRAHDVRSRGFAAEAQEPENIYRSNIQISELNALNAALAVIKYKQMRGFYAADIPADHHIFNVTEMKIYDEEVE